MKDDMPTEEKACSMLPEWMKKEGCHYKNGWLHVGNVAVDSGTVGIVDPLTNVESPDKLYPFFDKNDFGNIGASFFSSGFGGDGVYPILIKLSGKKYPMTEKILVNFNYDVSCERIDPNVERSDLGSCRNMFDFLDENK